VIFLRVRGYLASFFLGRCGIDLRLGRNISFYNPSKLWIGSHVYLAYGCVCLAGEQPISIGDQVIMGPYCVLASSNHTCDAGSFRYGEPESAPITIKKGSWLGAHVVVTSGSTVGQGSLIAAGAIVVGSLPDRVMAGGVPAKVIKAIRE
jgi:maltose O-acetyltransferase